MAVPDWSAERGLAHEIDRAAAKWQQGDILEGLSIVRLADADRPLTEAAATAGTGFVAIRERLPRAVIISQTCEVVRPCAVRPMVHIAAVVELTGATRDEARRGWRPQYVAVPWADLPDHFADLERQGTVEKSILLNAVLRGRCADAAGQMEFGSSLGRHRSRFAFPDDLNPTLKPLISRLREKAGKDSPQGRRIDEIREIRARAAPSWDADRLSVELIFLVNENSLPPVPDDMDPSTPLLETIADGDAQRLAERLDTEMDPVVRNLLWQRLVDGWARRAQPTGVLTDVTARAAPISEFSRAEELQSPELDLDHLSPS